MSSPTATAGGIVLCGGRSTRMGQPKYTLPFGNELLLQRIVRIVGQIVSPVVVVAAENQPIPELPTGVQVVRDDQPDLGPLAAIAVGLEALEGHVDCAYVSSCDVPLLQPEFVRQMLSLLGGYDLVMPQEGKFHHPLAGVYRTHLHTTIRQLIQAGKLRPVFLLEECNARTVNVEELRVVDPELLSLKNTNTPEEYAAIVKLHTTPPPPAAVDVRMKGFQTRTSVADALRWVNQHALPGPAETVPLADAWGRRLAEAVRSPLDVPAFDRSAMDGYALRGQDTEGASEYNPLTLRLIGRSLPGQPFPGTVTPGTCVRIMTGAPIPAGADAVLPAEYASEREEQVELSTTVPPAKHIGRRGEDIRQGAELLPAGRKLRPQDLGVLASVGLDRVSVIRRPRVRLLTTGNEIVPPGSPRGEFQIYDANTNLLLALLQRDGGILESARHLRDDRESIRTGLTEPGVDVILVSGGSSVGAEDHAPLILAETGELSIHGIAMRPSSPAGMGRIGETLVFLLPGNPVSCLCAYDFFAGRAIRLRAGHSADWPYRSLEGTLERKISSVVGRLDYCRVTMKNGQISPLSVSGASILSSTTRADGFVIIPPESEGYPPGSRVTVYLYG